MYSVADTVYFTVWAQNYDSTSADAKFSELCRYYQQNFGNPVRQKAESSYGAGTAPEYAFAAYKDGKEDINVSIVNHERVSVTRIPEDKSPIINAGLKAEVSSLVE